MSTLKPLQIDIVSDVVCPWCYIGKRRIENALALAGDVPVEIHWRPFFLNNWVPREGISRDEYLTAKFGSPEAYKGIAGRVVAAATEEGLLYRPELVKREAPAREPAGHVLDPVQLGVLVRVGGLLPGPGPLEGDLPGVQDLPQPLPADRYRPGGVPGQVAGQLAQAPVRERQA